LATTAAAFGAVDSEGRGSDATGPF
jgi:hypothetical protein